MVNGQSLLLLVGLLALLALLLGVWQLLAVRRLRRELSELRQQLGTFQPDSESSAKANFSADLDRIERQRHVQVPNQQSSAEKYRYVSSLAEQGLDAKGIAAALQLAPAEVEQLLQLAKLKHSVQAR